MTFSIKCNKCDAEQEFLNGGNRFGECMEIGLTEEHGFQGSVVESIDLHCSNCDNEISI